MEPRRPIARGDTSSLIEFLQEYGPMTHECRNDDVAETPSGGSGSRAEDCSAPVRFPARIREARSHSRIPTSSSGRDDEEDLPRSAGSRNISLSLNRTFVLPETPRSIDFQLQGDDLVDIYLIYPQSIFALEPSTVRVREVGAARGGRRPRGTSSRGHALDVSARGGPIEDDASAPAGLDAVFVATDTSRSGMRRGVSLDQGPDRSAVRAVNAREAPSDPPPSTRTSVSPHPQTPALFSGFPPPPIASARPRPQRQSLAGENVESVEDLSLPPGISTAPRRIPLSRTLPPEPYTTFSQLALIPPLPSGALSSSWTIPPLYADVVARSPRSGDRVDTLCILVSENSRTYQPAGTPLLSPISLLGGAALRNNGPPGLFFVSRGNSLTSIVTSNGRSIMKNPISWSTRRSALDDAAPQHIGILVVDREKTIVVKVNRSGVQAITFEDGASTTRPVDLPSPRAEYQFLATHPASQQLFFAQNRGAGWTIECLAAR
ncbi:hypothetical protein JCM16303_002247 [Sporobolomyces ruberrimus]